MYNRSDALMHTSQQVVDQPKLQQEFQLCWFLWSFTAGWYKATKANKLDGPFGTSNLTS